MPTILARPLRLVLTVLAPVVLITVAACASYTPPPTHNTARVASVPIPQIVPSHFSFGIMSAPGQAGYMASMRTTNGTAWDYRYQYLAGGVNTGHGWSTWNSPAGQFATDYIQESASNGFTPAFVYYLLLQSNGPSGGSEGANDLAHLNSPSTMRAYYADWALLMQKIGAAKTRTLVVVEPDLWGFIEQETVDMGSYSAASVPASVSSSGYPDAQRFPNTAQGFAWTLLHIRDRYAPNAVLTLHESPWGSKTSVNDGSGTTLDAATIGRVDASFLETAGLVGNPTGVSTFDLISSDIADHDAGQSSQWWDPQNLTFPNFTRYLQYISAVAAATNRRVMLWQVPVGNQYFDTEDNSQGHTQDNKAQYILGHIADFAAAGVVGVLFGPGNGGTNVFDNRSDGVTNPAPISTFQCNRCNTHHSEYADDDGGYLRIFLGQYYRNGAYPLVSATATMTTATATTTAP